MQERLYRDATERMERTLFNQSNDEKLKTFNSQSSKGFDLNDGGNLKDFLHRQDQFLLKQKEKREQAANEFGE